MKKPLPALLALLVLIVAVPRLAAAADSFDEYWRDGKAEIDGYRLTVSRYGQRRDGHAALIYVTEPFSASKRVKVDDHTRNPEDTFDVLKLNLVRDFQTGIYDYNTMVSLFVRSNDFDPVKVTFSSAEWCGHVYSELLFDKSKVRWNYQSYFEDESGLGEIDRPEGGLSEDNLFIRLRGLRGDFLEPGESKVVELLPSAYFSRLSHREMAWVVATIHRRAEPETITVPAGEFKTIVYELSAGERNGTFYVERAYPHKIVRWELAPDVSAELTGSQRLAYWRLNNNGDESFLKTLGLPVSAK